MLVRFKDALGAVLALKPSPSGRRLERVDDTIAQRSLRDPGYGERTDLPQSPRGVVPSSRLGRTGN